MVTGPDETWIVWSTPTFAIPTVTLSNGSPVQVGEEFSGNGPHTSKVTSPPASAVSPVKVAVSEIEETCGTCPPVAEVSMVGDASSTTVDSFGSLHSPATAAFLASPS